MGARRDAGGGAQPAARGAGRGRLPPRRRDLRRGRRHQPGDRPARARADRGRSRRARSRASASTCSPIAMPAGSPPSTGAPRRRRSTWRMTCRHRGACLGRRDAAAQPGRLAHRLGARPARRAAHGHPRQYRRPPDAARHGRSRRSSAPTGSRPRATSATRSAPISRRSPPATTVCRSMWRCRRRPSTSRSPTACRDPDRAARAPTKSPP